MLNQIGDLLVALPKQAKSLMLTFQGEVLCGILILKH